VPARFDDQEGTHQHALGIAMGGSAEIRVLTVERLRRSSCSCYDKRKLKWAPLHHAYHGWAMDMDVMAVKRKDGALRLMKTLSPEQINTLKEYFVQDDRVLMAFLFGSCAKGRAGLDSDADIAIYLKHQESDLPEKEVQRSSKTAQDIWTNLERMIGREVDLVVLNDAAATVVVSALQGLPITIKDRDLYLDFLLRSTAEAADFREWVESYWQLKQRHAHATPA
jgi:uncharacterized protein